MDQHTLLPKDLAETAASFFNASAFQYRSQETAIDYVLLRQNQKDRIANLFKNDPFFTEDRLLAQFDRVEEESSRFIESLLQQLADQCKKLRLVQADHDVALRHKNTEARKLAEKNMELSLAVQAQRKSKSAQISQLEKKVREKQRRAESAEKECTGLRKLLREYEGEMEDANSRIEDLCFQAGQDKARMELMISKIDQLNLVIGQYEEASLNAAKEHALLSQQASKTEESQLQLARVNEELEQLKQIHHQLQAKVKVLADADAEQKALIQHLEIKLLEANGEIIKQENNWQRLKHACSEETRLLAGKESQWKAALQDLQGKTKLSIERMQASYEKKLKKVVGIYQREIKALKSSLSSIKQQIQKEMLVFFKMLQGDFKQKCKGLSLQF